MGTENLRMNTTAQAAEDLSTHQYQAFALVDGKVANNTEEASGIILNKPASGDAVNYGYVGEMKYRAGAAVAKGAKLKVVTSGYFITADSGDPVCGEAKIACTSGSICAGIFSFPQITDKADHIRLAVTPTIAIIAGVAYALDDNKVADNGEEADGVAAGAISSGTAGDIVIQGIAPVRLDPAKVSSAGDVLTVTTSGYFTPADSGDYVVAKALANIGSNAQGSALFLGVGYYLSV